MIKASKVPHTQGSYACKLYYMSSVKSSSRPTTPLSYPGRLRRFTSRDSLEEKVQPVVSRARPGRTFPMDFGFPDSNPLPASRRLASTRFASPSSYSSDSGDTDNDRSNSMHSSTFKPSRQQRAPRYSTASPGEEYNTLSRVWEVYVGEASKADSILVDGWNRSIDVLLVFTGLFSAVLTTFIIESYHLLIPDPADTTNALLAQLITLQTSSDRTFSPTPSPAPPSVSSRASLVNGLWFASLSCSLSTALLSMLIKQWLQAYIPHETGSSHQRSRLRQRRFMQLESWHVPGIINGLPMLLHGALLLFFAGLIVLLWSVDLAVSVATWVMIGLVQLFVVGSMLLAFIYPDCPYRHPVTEYLSRWLKPKEGRRRTTRPLLSDWEKETYSPPHSMSSTTDVGLVGDDELDAKAIIWLLTITPESDARYAALQGIADFPRDFTGFRLLREAGVLPLVEQAFKSCFHHDATVDLRWHLTDADRAEALCRAWLNLTRDTGEQWPMEILEPLWVLQDLKTHPDAAAIASCAIALSSLDSMHAQWEVISYLGICLSGRISLNEATQMWLLDSIIECVGRWEVPIAVAEETATKAVPILLNLLRLTEDSPTSEPRNAAALALYMFTCGPVDPSEYRSGERRRNEYCNFTVRALSSIVAYPQRFTLGTVLLDMIAQSLARFASPILSQLIPYPDVLRDIARPALTKLYTEGRIVVGPIPEHTVADVLHLIFPPTQVPESKRPSLVASLVENLEVTTHPDIVNWSIRSLEVLLSQCSLHVSDAFIENDGINTVLRSVKVGVDTSRLQIDSLRTLCAFIQSCAVLRTKGNARASELPPDGYFSSIFRSDFFETLMFVLASRRKTAFKQPQTWWLNEISRHWLPALVELCRVRPQEAVWSTMVAAVQDFAESNGEMVIGYKDSLASLDIISALIRSVSNRTGPLDRCN